MVMSQSLKSTNFTETQKSPYLENETFFFFFQIKKFINYKSRATYDKNSFAAEVTFKREWGGGGG